MPLGNIAVGARVQAHPVTAIAANVMVVGVVLKTGTHEILLQPEDRPRTRRFVIACYPESVRLLEKGSSTQ